MSQGLNIDNMKPKELIDLGKKNYNAGDYEAALHFFLKAAENNNQFALQWCGCVYRIQKDFKKAEEYFLKAFNIYDDEYSAGMLAAIYREENVKTGLKDIDKAVIYCQLAADKGNKKEMQWLGYYYECGKGKEKDLKKAIEWYKKALSGDDETDRYPLSRIGELLYEGGDGISLDYKAAILYLGKAANVGHEKSMYNLAMCYYLGGYGISADDGLAFEWFEKSAEAGNKKAMKKLSKLYSDGIGTTKNPEAAKMWEDRYNGKYFNGITTLLNVENDATEAITSDRAYQDDKDLRDKFSESQKNKVVIKTGDELRKNENEFFENDDYITILTFGARGHGTKTFIKAVSKVLNVYDNYEASLVDEVEVGDGVGENGALLKYFTSYFKTEKRNYKNIYIDNPIDMEKYCIEWQERPQVAILILKSPNGDIQAKEYEEYIKLVHRIGIRNNIVFMNICDLQYYEDSLHINCSAFYNKTFLEQYVRAQYIEDKNIPILWGSALKACENPSGEWGNKIIELIKTIDKMF